MGSYVPNTAAQQLEMLRECGFSGFEDLYRDIPDSVLRRTPLDIPAAASELEVRRILEGMAGKNRIFRTIFPRRGSISSLYPGNRQHGCEPGGIPHGLYALSGGDQPGRAAVDF